MTGVLAKVLSSSRAAERLCVGLDPHPKVLSEWCGGDTTRGLRQFCEIIFDALVESGTRICKPQVALFERHGLHGMTELAGFLERARDAGIAVIADVKRGDIGTSVAGYGEAWLLPGGDFESDAMTAVAYQGVGSLTPVMEIARNHQKGVFVLAATSNSEGWSLQSARVASTGNSVAATICADLEEFARDLPPRDLSVFGVVVGATVAREEFGLELESFPHLTVLAPGFGAQGAHLADLDTLFPGIRPRVIPAVSRSVYTAGPQRVGQLIAEHRETLGE